MRILKHPQGGFELWFWIRPQVVGDEWVWEHFSPAEMRCRASGQVMVSPVFMDAVQSVRRKTGIVMPVTSGYRSPAHNRAVSHTKSTTGPHPDAQAMDVAVERHGAYEVQRCAMASGFTGIGVKQHGAVRYLHLDHWHRRDVGTVWTYYEP